jgi:uncharacterized protein HemX
VASQDSAPAANSNQSGARYMKDRILMAIMLILGVIVAVFTLGGLRRNWFLQKAEKIKQQIDATEAVAREERQLQEERMERAKRIAAQKAELDKLLEDTIEAANKMLVITLLVALSVGVLGSTALAAEDMSDYEKLAALYYDVLDELARVKQQRDDLIAIAEGYKKQFEDLYAEYEKAEASITRLNKTVETLQDLAAKQNEIIKKLSSGSGLSLMGGLTFTPGSDVAYKPGFLVGLQWVF